MNTAGVDLASPGASRSATASSSGSAVPLAHGDHTSKLYLLLHLLANLPCPVLLTGPDGAGKTTLLRQIQAHAHDAWAICYVSCSPNLSFACILDEMLQMLRRPGQTTREGVIEALLEEQLEALSKQNRSLVLLLDDAGILMPGLLAALCQFARAHPPLRLAFSLRSDDIHRTTIADGLAIGDCQVVDLPPPTEAETKDWPRPFAGTAALPRPLDQGKGTFAGHGQARGIGIPGEPSQFIEPPPGPSHFAVPRLLLRGAIPLAVLAALAVAFSPWRLDNSRQSVVMVVPTQTPETIPTPTPNSALDNSAPSNQAAAVIQPPPPEPSSAKTLESPSANLTTSATRAPEPAEASALQENDRGLEANPDEPDSAMIQTGAGAKTEREKATQTGPTDLPPESDRNIGIVDPSGQPPVAEKSQPPEPEEDAASLRKSKETAAKPAVAPQEKPNKPPPARPIGNPISNVKNADWLLAQNPNAYTLQLITVSQFSGLVNFIKQIPTSDKLATFRYTHGATDLYPLFYGIYPNLAKAKEAGNSLPSSLEKPLPRPLKSIQQEIRQGIAEDSDPMSPLE